MSLSLRSAKYGYCCRNSFNSLGSAHETEIIKDAVDMTLHFLENREPNGIFNIGSGRSCTWNSLAAAIFKTLGRPERIEYIDMPETIREKYQYYTCADITKLGNSGYAKPPTLLEEAVGDYMVNYLVPRRRLGEE